MRLMRPGPSLSAIVLLGAMSPLALPQAPSAPATSRTQVPGKPTTSAALPANPNEYVRQVVAHELEEQDRDHSMWRYHIHREDDKNNQDRDVIETKDGQLSRLILVWGKPLSAEERQSDLERMQRQVSDLKEREHHAKREQEDGAKERQMFRLIPDAFIFKYDGEENGQVRLSFVPNPHFDPPNFEAKVYKSLKGFMIVDRQSLRMAELDGTLFEDVNFGWGFLARLKKGGTFCVKQKDIGDGHWNEVYDEVNLQGHAVFFKNITQKHKQTRTEWRRVPDSITIQQAYDMLLKDPSPSAQNQGVAALPR